MTIGKDLLDGPPPTFLPVDPAADALASGQEAEQAVREHPTSSLAWAMLSEQAWQHGLVLESYAFARVGYHRGLDALRRNGWKGHGPVPWAHEPNQGFLRCLLCLQRAAEAINEIDEAARLTVFLDDCDLLIPKL